MPGLDAWLAGSTPVAPNNDMRGEKENKRILGQTRDVQEDLQVKPLSHILESCGRIRLKTLSSLITADYSGNKRASAIRGISSFRKALVLQTRGTGSVARVLHRSSFINGSA